MERFCTGPVNRRDVLSAGMLACGGLTLPGLCAARDASDPTPFDKSIIMLYLHGGPSHLETYDLKPSAPTDFRSIFRPVNTNVPGIQICELFPRQARIADKFSLVRSLHHDVSIHSDGGIVVLTGKRPAQLDPTSRSVSQHPDFGSVTSHQRSPENAVSSRSLGTVKSVLPQYMAIPRKPYMTRPNYVGAQHGAFELGDPSTRAWKPPNLQLIQNLSVDRVTARRQLLKKFDQFRKQTDLTRDKAELDPFHAQAFDILTQPQMINAFDLTEETETLRNQYGNNIWGRGCLLARRLAEAGVGVVNLYINTPKNGPDFTNWDDHISNAGRPGHFGKYMEVRLPYLDQCLATLIEDIYARNLDRKVMVVVVGEFGRTPRLSHNSTGTGRNHWPQAYTALVSGGGLAMGRVVGSTNSKGEYPQDRPHTPQDLLATVYSHLGIDHRTTIRDYSGRPVHILEAGNPIQELC